ncbi:MAG: class I SAM-dependent methyltransferase [Gammaproteobacteria bacterium]|jgi:SAM-dependent methyltransferase|nr:class I SAM-dependent methyltransferase [Gammaproteobacteria bacterium]
MLALKRRIIALIQSQHFMPNWWGVFVNPYYIARKGLYEAIKPLGNYIQGKTLDIGCGQKPYQHLCASSEYIGLELDTPDNRTYKKADYYYDGKNLPFENATMDSVVTHQVFEHVFQPNQFLSEIQRVLKSKGTLMLSVPFVWDEHEQPHDFARYSSFALKALLQEHGFEIVTLHKSVANLGLIFQLLNAYLYKKLFTKNGYWNQLVCLFIMSPITILGVILGKFLPANQDLYLDNIVIATKI